MQFNPNETVGEWVARDFRTAAIFKKHNIDFCCNGKRTLQQACTISSTPISVLKSELLEITTKDTAHDIDKISKYPLDILIEHIVNTHHVYVTHRSGEILTYLDKVVRVHGSKMPELAQIKLLFEEGAGELAKHMKKEELILFPAIERLATANQNGSSYEMASFGSIQNPIKMMEHEHEVEGDRFDSISNLTNEFTPPEWACNTMRVTFALLEEFQNDLHVHIHLENNILFPNAIKLEQQHL
ncbi:MAG: iron-sulfur cluster repair di-iron protein [Bacteroidetes bacterium]|nr:MAG: iron-sulfur cluster repair di-iron protein [Bacteroidota bacterium]